MPYPVVEAPAAPGAWCKAAAVVPAVEALPDGIVVMHDADVFCDGLTEAVQAVADGAAWAVPHTLVHRLTEEATRNVLSGVPDDRCEQRPYPGIIGGGILVARRDVFLDVPMDARFVGWGQEDDSYGFALTTLLGPPWRGVADLIHLWHPPQERIDRIRGSREGWILRRRYAKARRDPVVMRALVEEGRLVADDAHQPAVPPAAAVNG